MTNFEKIKNMSVDEMAESTMGIFGCPYDADYSDCINEDCIKCTKHWFESEVEE